MTTRIELLDENELPVSALEKAGIELSPSVRKNLEKIALKTNNNCIGYYQFISGQEYCKVFVLPKIYPKNSDTPENLQQKFFEFFKNYFRLKLKYKKIRPKNIGGNITDMAFERDSLEGCTNIEDFLFLKYEDALLTVKKFFQSHRNSQFKTINYVSQTIRHKIDLASNIKSLDKANIHQKKREAVSYSKIASAALSVLESFRRERINYSILPEQQNLKNIRDLTVSNISFLKKRFHMDKNFNLTSRELIEHRTAKMFQKNIEHRKLYESLLILAGIERIHDGENPAEIIKMENMTAIFFNPSDLFEWIVYDYLQEKFPDSKIYKDKLHPTRIIKTYFLCEAGSKNKFDKKSKPDFLVTTADQTIVVDAKWKVLQSLKDINYEDVAKLKRDYQLRSCNKAILIYPLLPEGNGRTYYFDNDESFMFELKAIENKYLTSP